MSNYTQNTQKRVSNRPRSNLPSMRSQQGIALIAVVMILIMISILGAASVGLSIMNQGISQNSQAGKLLRQSSNVPTAIMMKPDHDSEITRYSQPFGPLGYLTKPGQEDSEYVSCYRPQSKNGFYEESNYLIIRDQGTGTISANNSPGYCDLEPTSFTSKRELVATQVIFTRPNLIIKKNTDADAATEDESSEKAFDDEEEGSDVPGSPKPIRYRSYTVSVLPSMTTSATDADIKACLQKPVRVDPKAVYTDLRQCLKDLNVPMNIQVQDFVKKASF